MQPPAAWPPGPLLALPDDPEDAAEDERVLELERVVLPNEVPMELLPSELVTPAPDDPPLLAPPVDAPCPVLEPTPDEAEVVVLVAVPPLLVDAVVPPVDELPAAVELLLALDDDPPLALELLAALVLDDAPALLPPARLVSEKLPATPWAAVTL